MKTLSILRGLIGLSLPSSRRLYAVWTRLVCPFWGAINMACLTNLRSDYPLLLTLLALAYPCALTWSYIARRISPRAIPVPLSQHNQPAPVRIFIRFCSNFCLSACALTASESTWRLTPATACPCEFQPHADEQLMPTVEHQCANLLGSSELDFRESAASLAAKSAHLRLSKSYAVVWLAQAEFDERMVLRFCGHSVARLFADSLVKSAQIRRSTSCLKAEEP
jgi:hypothetical protein